MLLLDAPPFQEDQLNLGHVQDGGQSLEGLGLSRDGLELVSGQISGVWPNLDRRDLADTEVSAFYPGERPVVQCGVFLLWPICSSSLNYCSLSLITEIPSFICSCTIRPGPLQSFEPQNRFHQ